ncbi:MAG: carboxypeptidase regulatory-like domain-containing protein [Vulcanimicrobiota bacterium]
MSSRCIWLILLLTVPLWAQTPAGTAEHPLARDERVARKYAYSSSNKNVQAMMKADGFREVDKIHYGEDEAFLFKDENTGEYVIAFRGTELSYAEWEGNATDLAGGTSSVGEYAYLQMKEQLGEWVRDYGRTRKLRVVGHSKGGGLALHFTADYYASVSRTLALNAPAQSEALADQYAQRMARTDPDDQPEVVVAVSAYDKVSDNGDDYVGADRLRVVVGTGTDMGSETKWGHSAWLFANPDTRDENGALLRRSDDGRIITELLPADWKSFRRRGKGDEADLRVKRDGTDPTQPGWEVRFGRPPLVKLEAPGLINPDTPFEVVARVELGLPDYRYAWTLDGKPLKATSSSLKGRLDTVPPGVHRFGVTVTDRVGHQGSDECDLELLGNALTVSLKDGQGRPLQGNVTTRVAQRSTTVEVNGTRTFAIPIGPFIKVEARSDGHPVVTKDVTVYGGMASVEFVFGADLPIQLSSSARSVVQGERVKVTARLAEGKPPFETRWRLDGVDLPKANGRLDVQGVLKEPGQHQFEVEVRDADQRSGRAALTVEAAAAGVLEVTVTDRATGAPVAGAVVVVGEQSFQADGQGRLRLSLPPDQPVGLVVKANGYKDRTARGSVAAGQVKPYPCQLEREAAAAQPATGSRDPAAYGLPAGCVWRYGYPGGAGSVSEETYRKRLVTNPELKIDVKMSVRMLAKNDWERHGPYLRLFEDGSLWAVSYFNHDKPAPGTPVLDWWPNGNLRNEGPDGYGLVGGKVVRQGVWREYRRDGTLDDEYHYTSDPNWKSSHGPGPLVKWVDFDSQGQKYEETYYGPDGRAIKIWNRVNGWRELKR